MFIRRFLLIIVSFALAISLSIIPMPHWANWLRPTWVILVLCYWIMRYPEYINVGIAWLLGLLLDALYGTILGEHALAMIIVAYLIYRARRYLRHYPLSHQALFIVLCSVIYNFILYMIQWMLGQGIHGWQFWVSPFLGFILWPVLFVFIQQLQTKLRLL